MAVNKVVYNTENGAETLIDLTGDSVTPETLAKGATAHDASGNTITGTMKTVDELLENTTINDTLLWDGNTEGKTVFDMTGDGSYTYYPVSDVVVTLDDLANGLTLESSDINGNASEVIKLTDFAKMTNNVIASRSVSSVLFVLADNTSLYGSIIPKKGVYFMSSEAFGVYVSKIQIEGYTGFNTEVQVIKEKYIPDHTHKWGDIVLTDADMDEIVSDVIEALPVNDSDAPFENKKIVAIGDSIVQGTGDGAGGFLTALKNKYPSITTVNMGVGSTTFAVNNSVPANASSGCIFSRIDNIPDDADYIILEGGLNDFFHRDTYGVKFGEYVSNLHKYPTEAYYDGTYHQLYYGAAYGSPLSQVFYQDTFCGAFEMSLVKIMTRFYNKKYVLLIPHDPTGSAELAKYLDAEARICKKYGFPCIDLRLSSGMPRIKAIAGGSGGTSAYTVDEVHPSMNGYITQYLPAIERWLTDGSVENAGVVTLEEVLASTASLNKVNISVIGADGKTYTYSVYGTLTDVSEGGGSDEPDVPDEPVDPNKVPTSIDKDGTVFNGCGYQDGKRLSTSSGNLSDRANTATTTGFIKAVGGNDVYIGGLKWFNTTDGHNVIAAYKSDFTFIGSLNSQNGGTTSVKTIHSSITGGDSVTTVKLIEGLGIEYIRVSYAASTTITGANAIVTINEPIE